MVGWLAERNIFVGVVWMGHCCEADYDVYDAGGGVRR